MRSIIVLILLCSALTSSAQANTNTITTLDFVEILNDHEAEALHYYHHNWVLLREEAFEKGYIHSYEILETPWSADAPFHLILRTTYANEEQYALREEHFGELIGASGGLDLLNDLKPGDFRRSVYSKEHVKSTVAAE